MYTTSVVIKLLVVVLDILHDCNPLNHPSTQGFTFISSQLDMWIGNVLILFDTTVLYNIGRFPYRMRYLILYRNLPMLYNTVVLSTEISEHHYCGELYSFIVTVYVCNIIYASARLRLETLCSRFVCVYWVLQVRHNHRRLPRSTFLVSRYLIYRVGSNFFTLSNAITILFNGDLYIYKKAA